MLASIISFLGSFPRILDLIDTFTVEWNKIRVGKMKAANAEGLRKAVMEQNQIPLEETVGNPHAGEPSGIPGTEHRDSLPGVRQ